METKIYQIISSMKKVHTQYGAALIAVPIFCFLYNYIFLHGSFDMAGWIVDKKSFFFVILFYPIIEELAFRGTIQEYLAARTKHYPSFFYLTVANILTSILFVSIHFVHHQPIWALLTFFPSLIFGYFKEQYRHIFPSIFLHMFYNFSYFSLIEKIS